MDKELDLFFRKYGIAPQQYDPLFYAERISADMKNGLAGERSDMPMIPTYLSNDGVLPQEKPAVIIDAGGTNFRCALVSFHGSEYKTEDFRKCLMPGIEAPATWEEFISFVADRIEPLMDRADVVGFCFSYEADITPEMDGRVVTIDKEVKITGCKGKLIGKCLSEELEKRGFPGKKIIILNDTVAALLGGSASVDKSRYSGFIGQISGTGTNTCCVVPKNAIAELKSLSNTGMIVNMESGAFLGLPDGILDKKLDSLTVCPGEKLLEKKTAGVYLGPLSRLAFSAAEEEGMLCSDTLARILALGDYDAAFVDAWSSGEKLQELCAIHEDRSVVQEICRALLERSAKCMSAILLGIALCTDAGKTEDRPICDFAEGSLVQRSECYRAALMAELESFKVAPGRFIELNVVSGSTVPGSAAAALLNA